MADEGMGMSLIFQHDVRWQFCNHERLILGNSENININKGMLCTTDYTAIHTQQLQVFYSKCTQLLYMYWTYCATMQVLPDM